MFKELNWTLVVLTFYQRVSGQSDTGEQEDEEEEEDGRKKEMVQDGAWQQGLYILRGIWHLESTGRRKELLCPRRKVTQTFKNWPAEDVSR